MLNAYGGWLRPCTLGPFLLFGQKKWTKEKAARSCRHPLALLAQPGAAQLVGRMKRGSTQTGARLNTPGGAAMLGGGYGG